MIIVKHFIFVAFIILMATSILSTGKNFILHTTEYLYKPEITATLMYVLIYQVNTFRILLNSQE